MYSPQRFLFEFLKILFFQDNIKQDIIKQDIIKQAIDQVAIILNL